MQKLTFRAKMLYDYLITKSVENRWISKEEICEDNKWLYPRYKETCSEHNSTAFNLLRRDIDTLNRGSAPFKIICSSKKGYKIGTKEDAERYINRLLKTNLNSLKKTWVLKRKLERAGQITMTPEGFQEIKAWINEEDK